MSRSIISHDEAMQILRNDLRRLALAKHAAELKNTTPEKKAEILAQIERDIEEELQSRSGTFYPGTLCLNLWRGIRSKLSL